MAFTKEKDEVVQNRTNYVNMRKSVFIEHVKNTRFSNLVKLCWTLIELALQFLTKCTKTRRISSDFPYHPPFWRLETYGVLAPSARPLNLNTPVLLSAACATGLVVLLEVTHSQGETPV
jgi:hypothetical protein